MRRFLKNGLRRLGLDLRRIGSIGDAELADWRTSGLPLAPVTGLGLKIVDRDRSFLYECLGRIFQTRAIEPVVAELGVLRGENASHILQRVNPIVLYLLDSWSAVSTAEYVQINGHRPWVSALSAFEDYFGGALDDQATFDRLYEEVIHRFRAESRVQVIRADTREGLRRLNALHPQGFNLIYVDASHQYERVLDDLLSSATLLDSNYGCLILNDCCHSVAGVRQNLGVLEAAHKFCRMTSFRPVLAVNRDWTDVLFAPEGSPLSVELDLLISGSDLSFVEVPLGLLPNLRIRDSYRPSISFC